MQVVIASHSTPCGRGWLDNCLLELGTRWSYTNEFGLSDHIWEEGPDQRFTYRHTDDPPAFAKMYPSLMSGQARAFVPGIECISTHELPRIEYRSAKKLYVSRDFRDALRSAYRRGYEQRRSFAEFLDLLDSQTLLPLAEAIAVHAQLWLAQDNVHLVRFEDYKVSPEETLRGALDFLELEFDDEAVERALRSSSFESFKNTEATNTGGANFFVGPGIVNGWVGESDPNLLRGYANVTEVASVQLRQLGYDATGGGGVQLDDMLPILELLGLSERYALPEVPSQDRGDTQFTSAQQSRLARISQLATSLAAPEGMGDVLYGQPVGLGLANGSRYEATLAVQRATEVAIRLARRANDRLTAGECGWFAVAATPTDFHRDSEAAVLGPDGTLVEYGVDEPRLRSGPHVDGSHELLVEPTSVNLLTYTMNLDTAPWSSEGLRCEPDPGAIGHFQLLPEDRRGHMWVGQRAIATNAREVVISICAKSLGSPALSLQLSSGDSWGGASFDLEARRPIRVDAWGGIRVLETKAMALGATAARFAAVMSLPLGLTDYTFRVYITNSEGSAAEVSGHGIAIWAPQVEEGTRLTSPIVNHQKDARAVRAADLGTVNLPNGASWIIPN